jgi:hypothetical protein
MHVLFFWLNIAVKRAIALLKQYPVVIMGIWVIIVSFIVAGVDMILQMDTAKCITLLSLFTVISLIASLKQYNVTPVLLLYSKSSHTQKTIRVIFFVKKAFINNIPLLLLNMVIIKGFIAVEQYIYVPWFTIFSLLCSLLVMIVKNNYMNKRIRGIKAHKTQISAPLKSMIYDYTTHDFFLGAAIGISLFIIIFIDTIKAKNVLHSQDSQGLIFAALRALLSLGFSGIIDSIPHINWKYYALVSPQGFFYHFRKTAIFLLCFFGLFMAAFIVLGSFITTGFMFVNLYCMTFMFIFAISIAFTSSGMITKALLLMAAILVSLWTGFIRSYFMLLLVVPILVSLVKAKNEYKEWYLL